MTAKLDRDVVAAATCDRLLQNHIKLAPNFIRMRGNKEIVLWQKLSLPLESGVYALRLSKEYPGWVTLGSVNLHGPKTVGTISYEPEKFDRCDGWVYVGTSFAGINTRFQRQLRPSNTAGHMIYRAMRHFFNEANPVRAVFSYGTLHWIKVPGKSNTANRFFIEAKLIAALYPIFNVKSEH